VRRSGGVGSARPREVWRWGRRGGGTSLARKRSRFYVLVRTSEAGFGDAPPSGYSRGPPCPWPAPTSRSHRRRTPSGASARFGSPRSEASSGTARREVKNCAREITSTFLTRFREANRRDVGKQNLHRRPSECGCPFRACTPPSRVRPPRRDPHALRPRSAPRRDRRLCRRPDTRADHERFRAVHDHQRHARDAGGGARVRAG